MIGIAAALRRSLYARGVLAQASLPRPVISVGNLAAGGTGKTPHVQFLARFFQGLGYSVAVLSRGYRRATRGVVWVSRGEGPLVSALEGGDEPVLLSASLPGVAVLVGESRLAAGRACLESWPADLFLLDDGFQHLALRRDVDILLMDAERGLGNGFTLPFGPLREGPGAARFADALVVTKCADREAGRRAAEAVSFPAGRPVALTRFTAAGFVDRSGRTRPAPEGEVAAFCGIACNRHFAKTLREAGVAVRTFFCFPDHAVYSERDLEKIGRASQGLPLVTTEKDLVRLPEAVPFDVIALRVRVEFIEGWDGLRELLSSRIAGGSAR